MIHEQFVERAFDGVEVHRRASVWKMEVARLWAGYEAVLFPRAGHSSFQAKVCRKYGNSNRLTVYKRFYPFKNVYRRRIT